MIRTSRLENGIHVVTEWMPGSHSVSIGYWVDAGSRDEETPIAGASHFLEHLLFKGTATRSAREIAESIEAVGGDMNAFTTKEYTSFYTRLLDEDLELGLDILSDIMWAPAFRPEEIEAERQVILEEILMHEDEPSDLVHELFNDALFPGHPLGRPVLGDRSTITAMTRDAIAGYFEAQYRPESIVVAAAGNVDHDRVVAGVEKRFAGRPGARPPRHRPPLPPPTPVVVHNRPTEQAHLVVGTRALDRGDDDRFALSVLNQVLGGGMSSRLFQEIREKRGLVYSVYSYRAGYLESGALAIYAGTSPGRAEEVLELIGKELDRLVDADVSDRELTVAKGHVKGSLALSLEDSAGRMSRIGRSQLVHGKVMTFDELVARTEAVTVDDLRRVTERVVRGERVLAVVGPFAEDAFSARVA
ncbi:MAG TPA: pitrilysin family protein [Acidimicrobiales bacterium]|nr:pitrilysin family protein [Acidimicrobiales bacterium]